MTINLNQIQKNKFICIIKQRCYMEGPLPSPQQVLKIVTDFYCSLMNKKDIHQIVADIRQYVMHHDTITHKDYVARLLVDYFLKIEVKLKKKSQQQWDAMFELTTARDRACISLSQFPNKNCLRQAMRKIKEYQLLNQSFQIDIGDTQYTEFDDISIDQDVKIKTDYFFKWCLYVRHAKAYRELKQKDIENLKISKTFNNFGVKFNYFTGWKQFCKKKRMLKEKEDLIKTKSNDRIALSCVKKIQEITQIISIQNKLTYKVIERLVQCRKKQTFKRLADNKLKNKLRVRKLPKNKNLMFYLFLRDIIGHQKPNLSRSFSIKRQQQRKQQDNLLTIKCFKILKELFQTKKQKINNIKKLRQKQFVANWKFILETQSQLKNKKETLRAYLSEKKKKIAFIIFSFSHLAHQDQCKQLQAMLSDGTCKNTTEGTLVQVNLKKQMRKKWLICCKTLTLTRLKSLFKKLGKIKYQSDLTRERAQKINNLIRKRLFVHNRNYQINIKNTLQYFRNLNENRNDKMVKKSFRKWKKLKRYNKKQVQVVKKINDLHELSVKIQFWSKFRRQAHQKECIQQISDKMVNIINRIVFIKLAGRTMRINKEVQKFKNIKNKKLIRNLFNLFIINRQYKEKLSHQILLCHSETCKKVLLNRMRESLDQKDKVQKTKLKLEACKKNYFLKQMFSRAQEKACQKEKYEFLAKKNFLNYLFRSVIRSAEKNQEDIKKSTELVKLVKDNSELRFIQSLKRMIQQNNKESQKIFEVVKNIAKKAINLVKIRIIRQKNYTLCLKKGQNVQKMRKSNNLTDLLHQHRQKKVNNFYRNSKTLLGVDKFRKMMRIDIEIGQKVKNIDDFLAKEEIKVFYHLMKRNKQEMQIKQTKLQAFMSDKLKEEKKNLLKFMRDNKQNLRKTENLLQTKKHHHLSELMTTTLRGKFYRVKFNCSLKFYAKNLLRKGFKTIKRIHLKNKHKENMIRMEKTSSIMMEKSIDKSYKSNTLSEQVEKFNLRRSKQQQGIVMRAL